MRQGDATGKDFPPAPPYCAVLAVADPVNSDTDARLGGGSGDVCLVMLHRHKGGTRLLCKFAGIAGGEELGGVQVMGDHIELCAQQVGRSVYCLFQVGECRRIAHIAHVGG